MKPRMRVLALPASAFVATVVWSAGGVSAPERATPARIEPARMLPAGMAEPAGPVAPAKTPELTPPRHTAAVLVGDAASISAIRSGAARAVGLAAADFDGDGLDDVAAFFALGDRGAFVVHRADALARRPGAVDPSAGFGREARVFELPLAPGFFGAGDFDNDGTADVLVAAKGRAAFAVLPGDGAGGFGAPITTALSGKAAALVVGSVNREDSIPDIAAAVDTADGPRLEIHESPEGALSAEPEIVALPARPIALAIGELQGDLQGDIVALTGRELLIVPGRDRHLGETTAREAEVPAPTVERRALGFEGRSLALGRFTHEIVTDLLVTDAAGKAWRTPGHRLAAIEPVGERRPLRRVVAAHVSSSRKEDIVELDDTPRLVLRTGSGFDVEIGLESVPAAVLPLDLDSDASQDLVILEQGGGGQLTTTSRAPAAIFFVTNTNDAGLGSLRQVIADANLVGGPDEIRFAIPGAGPHVITTLGPLPVIVDQLTIDARTQAGYAGTPLVFLDGSSSGAACGLCFGGGGGADGSAVLGLGVVGFPGDGIRFDDTWASVVDECYLGVRADGVTAAPNYNGVRIARSQGDLVGGASGNLISGNLITGVQIEGGPSSSFFASSDVPKPIPDLTVTTSTLDVPLAAVVEDVDVVLDITHTWDSDLVLTLISPAGVSVQLAAAVGGSGDNFTGTAFDDEALTPIGAGAPPFTGSFRPASPLAAFDGGPMEGTWTLRIEDTFGADPGTLNSWRLFFQNRTWGTHVQRNRIGTDKAGTTAVGNGNYGVQILDEASDVVGGTGPNDGNLISGNGSAGVWIQGALSRGHRVEGNRIGTDASGTAALGNGAYGVVLVFGANGNTIGGTAAGAGNLISGHPAFGIGVETVRENRYQQNKIGTDITGTVALPNQFGFAGFDVRQELIGGYAASARNAISGNTDSGIYLNSSGSGSNSIVGNAIGTDATGSFAVGNGTGVRLEENLDYLEGNVISGNASDGVHIPTSSHLLVGNVVGLDITGSAPIPNTNGIRISSGRYNSIGNPFYAGNTIAGNDSIGVYIENSPFVGPSLYVSPDVPKAIPDLSTIGSTLFVPDDLVLFDVEVQLDLTHTYDADLVITLIDPAGTRIPLAQQRGASGDNYTATSFRDGAVTPIGAGVAPFSGTFKPEQPLYYLDGAGTYGTWTLEIADVAAADVGTLNWWQLIVGSVLPLDNTISNNWVGTNAFGSAGLENDYAGVYLWSAARNRIGGVFGSNTLSGNGTGVYIRGVYSGGNVVEGNYIGRTSTTNYSGGVVLTFGAFGNDVSSNSIVANGRRGVLVEDFAYNNSIRMNRIENNDDLGLDLDVWGVDPNDPGDADSGSNDGQNYPVITSLVPVGPNHQLFGSLDSEPNRRYILDFYANSTVDPTGYGEGSMWLGSTVVDTNVFGSASFSFLAPAGVGFYSATATGPGGSTSEFSGGFAMPQEVPDTLRASVWYGTWVWVDFTPTCGAIDHAVFWGTSPIAGGLAWTNGRCGFGTTGGLAFDPGDPPPGEFIYAVVVGQNALLEGSFGQDGVGSERPEAFGLGVCEHPLSVGGVCP